MRCEDVNCTECRTKDVERAKDRERHRLANESNASIGESVGNALDPRLTSSTKWTVKDACEGQLAGAGTRVPQYTPLLVQVMFELYCFPSKRAELCNSLHTLPRAQQEIMGLLERAGIVTKSSVHVQHGETVGVSIQYSVDEDALRAYVNAVCSVPLPRKHWVMP
jgi:hypothetical protein